jgi:uncharacterized protein YegL
MLVLDASASMSATERGGRSRIDLLNEGIAAFHAALTEDELALSRVQIAAINVGGFSKEPQMFLEWTDAIDFQPFPMTAGYDTPLGAATMLALDAIDRQKAILREYGVPYTRPWLMILTDGAPTDSTAKWRDACQCAKDHEAGGKVQIFPIGIGSADLAKLSELSATAPRQMDGVRFRELFIWLSASLGAVSRSVAGARIDLPPTDAWSAVRL